MSKHYLGDRNDVCTQCDEKFTKPEHLIKHIILVHEKTRIASQLKIYQCKFCEKSIRGEKNLRRHSCNVKLERKAFIEAENILNNQEWKEIEKSRELLLVDTSI